MFSKCVVLGLILHVVVARSTGGAQENSLHETARSSEGSSVFGDFKFVFKVYQECATKDLTSCLKMKLITAMDRISRSYNEIPLFEGIRFVKEKNVQIKDEIKSEAELEATLPRSLEDRQDALDDIISNKVSNFFESHTLQVSVQMFNYWNFTPFSTNIFHITKDLNKILSLIFFWNSQFFFF